jgi:hypothetical protein
VGGTYKIGERNEGGLNEMSVSYITVDRQTERLCVL